MDKLNPKLLIQWFQRWRARDAAFIAGTWMPGEGLTAAVCKIDNNRPQVLGTHHIPGAEPQPAQLRALAEGLPSGNLPWVWVLDRDDYQLLVLDKPPISASEMDQGIRWAIESRIDFPADEASLAWMDIPNAQADTAIDSQPQIYAVASRRATVDACRQRFDDAGLPLKVVDIRETAQRNLAAWLESGDECLAVLSFEPGGALLTFTWRGELYLNRFVVQPLKDLALADELERERLIDRLASQYLRSLDFLARQYSFLEVKRLMVAPQPFGFDAVPLLAKALPHPVEAVDLGAAMDLAQGADAHTPEAQARVWSVLGAALRRDGART